MMIKKLYLFAFLLVFITILSLPLVKHMTGEDKLKNNENRMLSQKPSMPKDMDELTLFIKQMDDYFSDQFGFRQTVVSWTNKIRYGLFNEISSKQITVGKNGFIYFNSHSAKQPNTLIKFSCNVDSLPPDFQNKAKQYFRRLMDHAEIYNIKVDIAIIPIKSRVYPENLPKIESYWCENNPPAWWENLFQDSEKYRIYYPLDKMLALKNSMEVYLSKHFHWHGQLPYVLANDMMVTLWQRKINIDIEPTKTQIQSTLNIHFPGLALFDDSLDYDYKSFGVQGCEGHNCIKDIETVYQHNLAYTYKNPYYYDDSKLVVLADSFGQNIAKNFIRGFSEVLVIDVNHLSLDEQYGFYQWVLKHVKPTHLLHLLHDGGIYGKTMKLERLFKDIDEKGL